MRYPRQWEAEPNSSYCSSCKTGGREREYFLVLHIHRPGTEHHTRRVCAQMNYAQLLRLSQQIQAQLQHQNDQTEGGLMLEQPAAK